MNSSTPWLVPLWQQLAGQLRAGRLPQGLLLTGSVGVGKAQLAHRLAQLWLCQQPEAAQPIAEPAPCGQCQSCQLWAAGSHPDFRALTGNDNGRIGVDEVRTLQQQIATTAYLGGRRALLITDASRMSDSAANALLKTLEEPPSGTLIILTAVRREALLATIISRCQHWPLPAPDSQQISAFIAQQHPEQAASLASLCQQAPLTALEVATKAQLLPAITLFMQWCRDGRQSAVVADALAKAGAEAITLLWPLVLALWPVAERAAAAQRVAKAVAAVQLPGRNLPLVANQLLNSLAALKRAGRASS
jgi:DNA polymerase III subunit delta'